MHITFIENLNNKLNVEDKILDDKHLPNDCAIYLVIFLVNTFHIFIS